MGSDGEEEERAAEQALCVGAAAVHQGEDFRGHGVDAGGAGGAQVPRPRPQPFLRGLRIHPFCRDFGPHLQAHY